MPTRLRSGRAGFWRGAIGVFGGEAKAETAAAAVDVKTLHAKIGELTLENDFLE
jgi:transposase